MRNLGKTILHSVLALWVLEILLDEWDINETVLERNLATEEELVVTSDARYLVKLADYELLSGGNCVDSNDLTYASIMYMEKIGAGGCADRCSSYDGCRGFDIGDFCYIYFDTGALPPKGDSADHTEVRITGTGGTGDIFTSNGQTAGSSCFYKRRTPEDNINHLDSYVDLGDGYCHDSKGNEYSTLAYFLGVAGTVEDCAEKCDGFSQNLGFTWEDDGTSIRLCLCHFTPDELPFDPDDEDSLKAIPGASNLSERGLGKDCAIAQASGVNGYTCYVKKVIPTCVFTKSPLTGGVSGDPLFMGLHGQVFKFEGRSGAWYSNVATKKLQWNLRFNEFETCPEHENMFVTGTTITLYHLSSLPFTKPEVAHTISIMVADEEKFFPGCQSGVCLGKGSLKISVDGNTDITSPGDYYLGNNGGRVIAHNTFAACSRKWYDYVMPEIDDAEEKHRLLHTNRRAPLEFLNDDKGDMLDPENCAPWIKDRAQYGDLFSQEGGWSTIHIETPAISFHVEYRQDEENCYSHSIDAYISQVASVYLEEEWQGVLGETREPKFYPNGEEVMSERSYLLSAKDDKDYEVDGPFGNKFTARIESPGSSSS